ncbi:hypothetical protein [Staphylococcus casei]|uniref:RNA polymerase sigma-70 region 4 domain-containing protein n=1 Tax=Staphylococcus casei TaxID=201828 RepID=A0ABZ2WA85_9STAP
MSKDVMSGYIMRDDIILGELHKHDINILEAMFNHYSSIKRVKGNFKGYTSHDIVTAIDEILKTCDETMVNVLKLQVIDKPDNKVNRCKIISTGLTDIEVSKILNIPIRRVARLRNKALQILAEKIEYVI